MVTSSAESFVVKSVHYALMQLSVTFAVLTEVPVLLLVHVHVFLNGLDPLVLLVGLKFLWCCLQLMNVC